MTLIKSVSGIRGTIGGKDGDNLTPIDIVKFSAAYAGWISENEGRKVVIGRDGRISGEMVSQFVAQTLIACGLDVVDLGLSTTPTVEMSVKKLGADGGIIVTASHNPKQWNALKLLNKEGEFINADEGRMIEKRAEEKFRFSEVDKLGAYEVYNQAIEDHAKAVCSLELVDVNIIAQKKYKVVVDVVNSTGAISLPVLLEALGVECILINDTDLGHFYHNPEPLPQHLEQLSEKIVEEKADLGFAVDPDVDRLVIFDEKGNCLGEEYTLVSIADYILNYKKGPTVSNLSSTRALKDVSEKHGVPYHSSAVGEVHVVEKMKSSGAVIGGEGNGGIIYPELHFGRDALVGIALFLSHLAKSGLSCSALRAQYPDYFMAKKKARLKDQGELERVLNKIKSDYRDHPMTEIDGLKIEMSAGWVHMRKSNTEPIIRIYTEAPSQEQADEFAAKFIAYFD